jgi:hypothetical protein
MKSCFNVARGLISVVLCILLFILIFVGIPVASISRLATNSESVKNWLYEGGVYENVPSIVSAIMEEEADKEVFEKMQLEEGKLIEVVSNILEEEWLKENFEKAIDSVYVWLKGESEIPQFEIDISDRKEILVSETSDYFKEIINSLPECSQEQEMQMAETGFEPLEAECRPSYMTDEELSKIDDKLYEGLEENEAFEEGTIKSENFFELDSEATDTARKVYGIVDKLPFYVFIAIIGLTLILVFLIPGMPSKFLMIGIVWTLSSALLLFGLPFGKDKFYEFFDEQLEKIDSENAQVLIDTINGPVEVAVIDVQGEIGKFVIIFLVLGIVLVIGGIILKFSRRKYYVEDEKDQDDRNDQDDKSDKDLEMHNSSKAAKQQIR